MTNEEWISGLSTEEKAKFIAKHTMYCEDGIKSWLEKEHIEPLPILKVGDIVQTKPYCRVGTPQIIRNYVAIDSLTLIRAESKERVFLCDIGDIVQVWRSEGAEYQCIWRAE